MDKADIVKDAIRRFAHLPKQTVARHILATHGNLWDGNLEAIRNTIRYYTGANGDKNRSNLTDCSMVDMCSGVPMPETWRRKRDDYHMPSGLWLILSDVHVPFHEPRPLETAIKWGQVEKVDGIFLNGDIQDCASVTFWPTARRDFNKEVEQSIDFLDFLMGEFPGKPIVYKAGNHELRLPRRFVSKLPELAESPLAAMETVIGFEERGIEFLDYFQLVYFGDLPVIHGHEVCNISRTVNPARGLYIRTKTFSACSHCHSTSEHTSKAINGTLLTTWSFGCLCDLNPEYNPLGNDWNWGAGMISVEDDGNFEVVNRRILSNGKLV